MKALTVLILFVSVFSFSVLFEIYGYTTSDWTSITSDVVVNEATVLRYEGVGNLTITFNGVDIHKPQFDDSRVDFKVILDLSLETETPTLTLVITKGDIGETSVKLRIFQNGEWMDLGNFRNSENVQGDPTNMKTFVVKLPSIADTVKASSGMKYLRTDYLFKERKNPRHVLAFYYAWYGTPEGPMGNGKYLHWYGPGFTYAGTDYPLMGLYDSWDESMLRKHMEMAYESGIDGFVVSWWGQGSYEADTVFKMLKIAHEMEKAGKEFYITLYYEGNDWLSEGEVLSDFEFIFENYVDDQNFLKYEGKPVIFIYSRAINALGGKKWKDALKKIRSRYGEAIFVADTINGNFAKIFGGMHTYNILGLVGGEFSTIPKRHELMLKDAHKNGIVYVMDITPGYDDTHIRIPGWRTDRRGGRLYEDMWREVLRLDPDMVVITSWNEWHEGSEIEPSKEYGDLFLKLTEKWAKLWKERDDTKVDLSALKKYYHFQFVDEASLLRASMYVPPDNKRIYIASDNLLARYALELLNDPLSKELKKKLEDFGGGYNDKHDVIVKKGISGEFYSMYNEFIDYVQSKKFGRLEMLYEKPDKEKPISRRCLADLTAYVSMNCVLKGDRKCALSAYKDLLKMWDGCGMKDSVGGAYYQTYKTALFVLASKRISTMFPDMIREHIYDLEKAVHTIAKVQDVEGGFTVGYECKEGEILRADDMNTETTSIVTIALLEEE